ncbi:MAG: isochorismate synthase [Prevotella sp.]|nr:isochorismate synthase [Prevotella sp.]
MNNYVCYRLPEETHYTFMAQTDGQPAVVDSVRDLASCAGFVMAPFVPSSRHPVLLLRPDVVERREVGLSASGDGGETTVGERSGELASYRSDFARFHEQIVAGRFSKLVLSRCSTEPLAAPVDAHELFLRACRIYPHQFIALVSMREAGTWLMATPEVLLEGSGDRWRTMALAGTMKVPERGSWGPDVEWSEKNLAEQRYVSAYISDILRDYTNDVSVDGPYTTMAAHLLHLRTDFAFRLRDSHRVGELLDALHPTPAVCGIPKDDARQFIIGHESVDRKYYSGFCGPLAVGGMTRLYVSLRCMEICPDHLELHAGGGILSGSDALTEWQETQTKMQTMQRLITP